MRVLERTWRRWYARKDGVHRIFKHEIRRAPVSTCIELTFWPALAGLVAMGLRSWIPFMLGMSLIAGIVVVVPFLQDLIEELDTARRHRGPSFGRR